MHHSVKLFCDNPFLSVSEHEQVAGLGRRGGYHGYYHPGSNSTTRFVQSGLYFKIYYLYQGGIKFITICLLVCLLAGLCKYF